MRYVIKQKWLTLGDKYSIRNENGDDVFYVNGRVFSFGDKLSLTDADGHELAFIAQKLLAWGPTYNIHVRGQHYATVKKKLFTLFRCRFEVDIPGPDDLVAQGSFLDHEYTFTRHGEHVASVSKKWFSWTDTYGVDIADGEDEVLILASAIVIDLACHNKSDTSVDMDD
ncbi:MAG: LURP-one-related family protein [Fuerstiella sp.]